MELIPTPKSLPERSILTTFHVKLGKLRGIGSTGELG
jgi:hypothetical protein